MIFAKLGQFVSCDTVGEIETIQAELVLYLQSVCLSVPLQPAAPGNEVSNLLFMYDMEQPLRSNTITHICGIKGCGGAGWPPPPIIFERLQLRQQIIYRRKENLSESPNHQKYWENILVSRFYEQFSRNRRNLGHFRKFEKISNS